MKHDNLFGYFAPESSAGQDVRPVRNLYHEFDPSAGDPPASVSPFREGPAFSERQFIRRANWWAWCRRDSEEGSLDPDMAPKPPQPPNIFWPGMKCYLIGEVVLSLLAKARDLRDIADSYEQMGLPDIARMYDDSADEFEQEAAEGTMHQATGNCGQGV